MVGLAFLIINENQYDIVFCNDFSLGCTLGVYGTNCDMNCPFNCKDQMCDIINGTCFGCELGWTGDTCKQGNVLFENIFFFVQYQNYKFKKKKMKSV